MEKFRKFWDEPRSARKRHGVMFDREYFYDGPSLDRIMSVSYSKEAYVSFEYWMDFNWTQGNASWSDCNLLAMYWCNIAFCFIVVTFATSYIMVLMFHFSAKANQLICIGIVITLWHDNFMSTSLEINISSLWCNFYPSRLVQLTDRGSAVVGWARWNLQWESRWKFWWKSWWKSCWKSRWKLRWSCDARHGGSYGC